LNKEDLSGEYFHYQTGLSVVVAAEHREGGLPGAIISV
jgi:hypothetical protein